VKGDLVDSSTETAFTFASQLGHLLEGLAIVASTKEDGIQFELLCVQHRQEFLLHHLVFVSVGFVPTIAQENNHVSALW